MNAKDRITKGMIKLTLNKPLYGLTLMYLVLKEASVVRTYRGPVSVSMGTDGVHLYYNPEFVDKLSDTDLTFVLCHEAYHILAGHVDPSFRKRFFLIFDMETELAMDFEDNAFLMEQESLQVSRDVSLLYNKDWSSKEWPAERIYEELKERKNQTKDMQTLDTHMTYEDAMEKGDPGNKKEQKPEGKNQEKKKDKEAEQDKSGKGENDQDNEEEKEDGKGENDQSGKDQSEDQGQQERGERDNQDGEESEDIEQQQLNKSIQELSQDWKSRTQQIIQQAIMMGKVPADLKKKIEERLYPKKDWREELQEFLQFDRSEYSFSPPDRRFLYMDIVLPDLSEQEKLQVVVARDTSGSISDRELDLFTGEVRGILKSAQNVECKVIDCDAEVHGVYDINDEETLDEVEIIGRGGTDFRPVFEEIKGMNMVPHVVVYLTDGEGTFPEEVPPYPVLWAVKNTRKIEIPFGRYIEVHFDEER